MFYVDQPYRLANQVAALEPLSDVHTEPLLAVSQDPDLWTYFLEKGYGETNFREYLSKALHNRRRGIEYPFVIKDLRQDEIAGMTRIYAIDNQLKHVKVGHSWIGKRFQGTGLNKACKYLLFEFLFDQLEMERIGFGASEENTHSIRAMKGVGCQVEGRLRSFMPGMKGDKRVDIILLSLLRAEWEGSVKSELGARLKSDSPMS